MRGRAAWETVSLPNLRTEKGTMDSGNQCHAGEHRASSMTDDRNRLEQFIAGNSGKPCVVVQGLGFVGAVMALVCANAHGQDYAVIGVDRADESGRRRVSSLNEGVFPLVADDPKIEQLYRSARERNNLCATCDDYAYSLGDVIVVDINLDVDKTHGELNDLGGYSVDLTAFRAAMRAIARRCREDVLVLVETTVPPGTCEQLVKPVIEEGLRQRGLATQRFRLGHSCERVMPGRNYVDSIRNFYRAYAGIDDRSADATAAFLSTVVRTDEYPLTRLAGTNASEMTKVLENAYRAMNIAFIAEWSRFAEEAGVNLYEVIDAIRKRPTHSNMMYPGVGVGGYCLTKDPLMAAWARKTLFGSEETLPQSEAAVRINDRMPVDAFRFIERAAGRALAGAGVVLLGVSYRGDVGDTRSTPVGPLFDLLVGAGSRVTLHDPYVSYWPEKELAVERDLSAALAGAVDLVVVSTGHALYRCRNTVDALQALKPAVIIDTLGLFSAADIERLQTRHRVKVLGRGDL